jgi:DNA modification methylase
MVTDPPYGVEYDASWRDDAAKHSKSMGNRKDTAKGVVLNDDKADWRESWGLFPGDVAYVWHAGVMSAKVADSLEASGFSIRSQVIWAKNHLAIGRSDYHWQHEPCQPAGTMVSKVLKEGRWREHSVIEQVPIETLKAGDKVVSFGNTKIFRRGREITCIGSRAYTGNMHHVSLGGLATRATAEHQFTIRFAPDKAKSCIMYIMRRGDRWRIGVCTMFNSRGFGLAVRLDQECGEEAWIVSAHPDMRSARVSEQVASCIYGIPTTHWETDRSVGNWITRSKDDIDQIYRQIGTHRIADGVQRLMLDYGLNADYPIITHEEVGRFSRKQSRVVRACNLIPGVMQLPVPTKLEDFDWVSIDSATFGPVKNIEVWSMNVDQDQHYVADGIVTHNCWYAVRTKATGHWNGDRKQSTLWKIDKPQKSETGHSTQKPVECMLRPIQNNSSPGQAVYEPFSGSGTTIAAAELSGRCCHAIELNPQYVDVAVERWQNLSGQDAIHADTGKTFAAMKAERLANSDTPPAKEIVEPKAEKPQRTTSKPGDGKLTETKNHGAKNKRQTPNEAKPKA